MRMIPASLLHKTTEGKIDVYAGGIELRRDKNAASITFISGMDSFCLRFMEDDAKYVANTILASYSESTIGPGQAAKAVDESRKRKE